MKRKKNKDSYKRDIIKPGDKVVVKSRSIFKSACGKKIDLIKGEILTYQYINNNPYFIRENNTKFIPLHDWFGMNFIKPGTMSYDILINGRSRNGKV